MCEFAKGKDTCKVRQRGNVEARGVKVCGIVMWGQGHIANFYFYFMHTFALLIWCYRVGVWREENYILNCM